MSDNTPTSSSAFADPPLPSLILPSVTSHRRLLPIPAAHSFSYPLMYLGVDIDELESGRLDVGLIGGAYRMFGWGPSWRALLSVQESSYLATQPLVVDGEETNGTPVDKEKAKTRISIPIRGLRPNMLTLLKTFHDIDSDEVGRIWLISMPSYLGKGAMNPLSVWLVYRKLNKRREKEDKPPQARELLCVVLEVHNTFGERHMYVLRSGKDELPVSETARGHDHAWITHRNFHVSPFNNRDGYYRLDLKDPFSGLSDNGTTSDDKFPGMKKFKITLNVLTADKAPKLWAVLQNHPSPSRVPRPITRSNIASCILWRQPFDLLLTSPRILIQAWSLHYRKGLLVYPRPEPEVAPIVGTDGKSDLLSLDDTNNPVGLPEVADTLDKPKSWLGNALGWQPMNSGETRVRAIVLDYLQQRADAEGIVIKISSTNRSIPAIVILPTRTAAEADRIDNKSPSPADSGYASAEDTALPLNQCNKQLQIRTRHPQFFTQLAMSPSPDHFLAAAKADRHTVVSDESLFSSVFSNAAATSVQSSNSGASYNWLSLWTQRQLMSVRQMYLFFLLSFCSKPIPPLYVSPPPAHFLRLRSQDSSTIGTISTSSALSLLWVLWTTYLADVLEEKLMTVANARFVEGYEPWGTWNRAISLIWETEGTTELKEGITRLDEQQERVKALRDMNSVYGSVFNGVGVKSANK